MHAYRRNMLISFLLHIAGIVLLLLLTPSSAGIPRPSKERVTDPRILLSPVPGRRGRGSEHTSLLRSLLSFPRPSRLQRLKLQLVSGNRSGALQSAGRKLKDRMGAQA